MSLSVSTFNFSFASPAEVLRKLEYQIEVKDYLGAKDLANRVYQKAKDPRAREIAFLIYWLADGFLNYQKGQFNKILEDIAGLNLYWSVFRGKRYYEDLYFEYLGRLYTLLFQYRRAVIFYLISYRKKPTQKRLLEIIFATEMAYYNELRPYLDYSVIEYLLKRVDEDRLKPFDRALYEFERGFYNLLLGNYGKAYEFFKKSFDLDKAFITDGQADYFMGKALEGMKRYKDAYFYYKAALKKVKHPIYKANTLYGLFKVSALIGYYGEANDYYFGLTHFGGLEVNPYLQEATLLIPYLDDFLNHFYWKRQYNLLVAKIMWLNFNNDRGRRAFAYFLNLFLDRGILYPDFVEAWSLLYPREVAGIRVDPKKVLKLDLEGLRKLHLLYEKNRSLFLHFFGDYGVLALAKYYFLTGDWEKAYRLAEGVKPNIEEKLFILGVIEAYRGEPYRLEAHYQSFKGNEKVEALFWLGWGYLLRDRWDLVSLYWEDFLRKARPLEEFYWEKLFATYYLALHYDRMGFADRAVNLYRRALELLEKTQNLVGLKRWIALRLAYLSGQDFKTYQLPVDNDWQKFLKYTFSQGGN